MKWVIISEKYLSYLRTFEKRIPRSDYGKDHFKPFFGILFEIKECCYVTQVSSAKERHNKMKQNLDFYKLYDNKSNKLLAVINLNYMFPVPKSEIVNLEYSRIQDYRDFESDYQRSQYIHFLKKELCLINKLELNEAAGRLYELKYSYPENVVSKRCLDYKRLEELADKYCLQCD